MIPLIQEFAYNFWLAAQISFSPFFRISRMFKLNQISLIVLRGNATDPLKDELFRAEWLSWKEGEDDHAQPHWHLVERGEWQVDSFQPTVQEAVEDFVPPEPHVSHGAESVPLKHFHFAMASTWQSDDKHRIMFDSEAHMAKWLGGCVSYIRNELAYLSKKTEKLHLK